MPEPGAVRRFGDLSWAVGASINRARANGRRGRLRGKTRWRWRPSRGSFERRSGDAGRLRRWRLYSGMLTLWKMGEADPLGQMRAGEYGGIRNCLLKGKPRCGGRGLHRLRDLER